VPHRDQLMGSAGNLIEPTNEFLALWLAGVCEGTITSPCGRCFISMQRFRDHGGVDI